MGDQFPNTLVARTNARERMFKGKVKKFLDTRLNLGGSLRGMAADVGQDTIVVGKRTPRVTQLQN